jgi:hypothetical protein
MGRKRKEKLLRKTERAAARPEYGAPPPLPREPPRLTVAALVIFAALFILITVSAFLQKSTTVDEPVHLVAGYSYLKWGDFRLNPEHPPIAKIWASLPLLASGPPTPPPLFSTEPRYFSGTITARELSSYFPGVPLDRLFFYPKLMMVLIAVALGAAIFAWTERALRLRSGGRRALAVRSRSECSRAQSASSHGFAVRRGLFRRGLLSVARHAASYVGKPVPLLPFLRADAGDQAFFCRAAAFARAARGRRGFFPRSSLFRHRDATAVISPQREGTGFGGDLSRRRSRGLYFFVVGLRLPF